MSWTPVEGVAFSGSGSTAWMTGCSICGKNYTSSQEFHDLYHAIMVLDKEVSRIHVKLDKLIKTPLPRKKQKRTRQVHE